MVNRLLVPLEGSPSAESVLPLVRRFDRAGVSEILLLRTEMPIAVDEIPAAGEVALERARTYLESVRRRLDGLQAPVRLLAELGPPGSTILECAREHGADMILATAARRHRLVRFLFGNVTERLVQRSGIPLLTLPAADADPEAPNGPAIRNLLVPLDGGLASRDILPAAFDLARSTGARILFLCVLSAGGRSRTDFVSDGSPREEFECAEEQLYAAGADCAAAGLDFSVLVEYGEPVDRILAVCRDRSVDGIAMATRGRSSLSRWLAPSATLRVLRQAAVPLLTVRSTAAARPVGLGAPAALGRH